MRHEIETTAPTHSTAAVLRLDQICKQIAREHSIPEGQIDLDTQRPALMVIARCNGAALRDLVGDLDRAGFLA